MASQSPYNALSKDPKTPALQGKNENGNAIVGTSTSGIGVWGGSQTSTGVGGMTGTAYGVHGVSTTGHGVHGDATGAGGYGVVGTTVDGTNPAVWGENRSNTGGVGVRGDAVAGTGVAGVSNSFRGVAGFSTTNAGVYGESANFDGVFGVSNNKNSAGVSGHNPGGMAGYFDGNLVCTGNISCGGDITLTGGDCAEQFQLSGAAAAEPGVVMVMNENGEVTPSSKAYDRSVVGVVSGAGEFQPAIILDDRRDGNRATIALMGRVYCKVDATRAPIKLGDPLTTAERPGHAMKAEQGSRSFGAVIGKALRSIDDGCDLIPVLVALQ
jgi:hypothetical protein